jgi:hypothetical protein
VRLPPAPVHGADDPRNSADDGAGAPFVNACPESARTRFLSSGCRPSSSRKGLVDGWRPKRRQVGTKLPNSSTRCGDYAIRLTSRCRRTYAGAQFVAIAFDSSPRRPTRITRTGDTRRRRRALIAIIAVHHCGAAVRLSRCRRRHRLCAVAAFRGREQNHVGGNVSRRLPVYRLRCGGSREGPCAVGHQLRWRLGGTSRGIIVV